MSTAPPSAPTLLAGLVDDAAAFPPRSAPLEEAVAEHRQHRRAAYGDVVGPLLVAASRAGEVARLLGRGERLRVGLVADGGPDDLLEAVRTLRRQPTVELVQVEARLPVDALDDPGRATRRLLDRLVVLVDAFVEIPLEHDWQRALDVVANAAPEGAKFRTGGTTAEAFPSVDRLAEVLVACARRRVRFKLTAGLHHAVRHTDAQTGFAHHGFLNVLCAVAAAVGDAGTGQVAAVLAERDPARLLDLVNALDPATARAVRALFASYGSCSVTEPVDDLVGLGLLTGVAR